MAGNYSIRAKVILDVKGVQQRLDALGKRANIKMPKSGLQGYARDLKQIGGAADQAGKKGVSAGKNMNKGFVGLGTHLKNGVKGFASITGKVVQFGIATSVIQKAGDDAKAMVGSVVELDASLTEFKKVSDIGEKGLKSYTDQAYKAGEGVARTGREMIDAATNFKKSGYTEQDSLVLAKVAAKFQNIADTELSAADSSAFIISQMKAFNIEAGKSEKIIDATNEVANNFAVGTNDLQLALTKTGSAMGTVGNTFEETIGIVTAGTEIMVGQPSKVGRG